MNRNGENVSVWNPRAIFDISLTYSTTVTVRVTAR